MANNKKIRFSISNYISLNTGPVLCRRAQDFSFSCTYKQIFHLISEIKSLFYFVPRII